MAFRQVNGSGNGMGIGVGMAFGMEGPLVNGVWVNPKTGDIIEVRDSMFEDNQLIVVATNGRNYQYEQLQNYIQCKDLKEAQNIAESARKPLGNLHKTQDLPKEVLEELAPAENNNDDGILADDLAMISGVASQEVTPIQNLHQTSRPTFKEEDPDFPIIKRALGDWAPEIGIVMKNKLPKEKIEALQTMFDISSKKIAQYIVEHLNKGDVMSGVFGAICNALDGETPQNEVKTETRTTNSRPTKMGDAKSQAASSRARHKAVEVSE